MMADKRQHGISMIEVMVSVAVSMLLLTGLINLMMNNQRTYRIDHNLAELQTNGRYATTFMARAVRLAGFRTPPTFSNMLNFSDFSTIFPSGAELIQGSNNSVNGSDTLTIRYQGSPSGSMYDCLAKTVQPNQIAVNTFSINNQAQLVCSAINNGVANPSNPAVLVDGVQAMQIRFGEDLDNDGVVDRYVPPNFAGINLNNVVSVRISFLLRSQDQVSPTVNVNTYALQDVNLGPFNDNYIRKVITTTIKLRGHLTQ